MRRSVARSWTRSGSTRFDALRRARTQLADEHALVTRRFGAIDAAAEDCAAAALRGVIAFHPDDPLPASRLPTVAEMADPTCDINKHAQRAFTQVLHLRDWLRLVDLAAAIGEKGRSLRELSRLIGVAQPLAGAWLAAIPASDPFRVRSEIFTIFLERRLGLPLSCLVGRAAEHDRFGDSTLTCEREHTTRHNDVVHVWCAATRAAMGFRTFETHAEPPYSPDAIPDFVSEFGGAAGAHLIGEVKVYNPIVKVATLLRRGACYAFGATEAPLRVKILGERAGTPGAPLPPVRAGAEPRRAKYQVALDDGHEVVPLIHEVWGGAAPEAVAFLRRLADSKVGPDRATATWATSSFRSYWGQRLSLALQTGVAREILDAANDASAYRRAV